MASLSAQLMVRSRLWRMTRIQTRISHVHPTASIHQRGTLLRLCYCGVLCLNPYIACRKDAFGVSEVIMQSSIVTGSDIWSRWSRLNPLYWESVDRCDSISLGVINSPPTARIKTPVTASLGWRPVRPSFPFSPPPSTRSNRETVRRPSPYSSRSRRVARPGRLSQSSGV
jgi:hypothetical protein